MYKAIFKQDIIIERPIIVDFMRDWYSDDYGYSGHPVTLSIEPIYDKNGDIIFKGITDCRKLNMLRISYERNYSNRFEITEIDNYEHILENGDYIKLGDVNLRVNGVLYQEDNSIVYTLDAKYEKCEDYDELYNFVKESLDIITEKANKKMKELERPKKEKLQEEPKVKENVFKKMFNFLFGE